MIALSRLVGLLVISAFAMSAGFARAAGDPVNGKSLYEGNCLGCHGVVPDTDAKRAAGDVGELQFAIANVNEMKKAILRALTVDQLTDITAYLATFVTTAPVNYQGLWWKSPGGSEDGWGINFAHQGETIFGTWFTYDTTGKGWWLTLVVDDNATHGVYTGNVFATTGPPFNTVPFVKTGPPPPAAGTATLTFTDANNGSFHYAVTLPSGTVSQTKAITRQPLPGALPTCIFGGPPTLAAATNYQDIWWAGTSASPGTESGWGINFAGQGNTMFASWFTYDLDGTPLWLVATLNGGTGDLYRPSGPRFDAYDKNQFNPGAPVGTMSVTFADGNNGMFSYSVKLPGMTAPVVQSKPITRQLFSTSGTTCN